MSDSETGPVQERRVRVLDPLGLHALPAARLVAAAARFRARITLAPVAQPETLVDSVMAVLSLGAGPGAELILRASGPDAAAAATALAALFDPAPGGHGQA